MKRIIFIATMICLLPMMSQAQFGGLINKAKKVTKKKPTISQKSPGAKSGDIGLMSEKDKEILKKFRRNINMFEQATLSNEDGSSSSGISSAQSFIKNYVDNPNWNKLPSLMKREKPSTRFASTQSRWDRVKKKIASGPCFDAFMNNCQDRLYKQKADGNVTNLAKDAAMMVRMIDFLKNEIPGNARLEKYRKAFSKFGSDTKKELGKNYVSPVHAKHAGKLVFTKRFIPAAQITESDLVTSIKYGEPLYLTFFTEKPIKVDIQPDWRKDFGLNDFRVAFLKSGINHKGQFTAVAVGDRKNVKFLQFAILPNNKMNGFPSAYDHAYVQGKAGIDLFRMLDAQAPREHTFTVKMTEGNYPEGKITIDMSGRSESAYANRKAIFQELFNDYKKEDKSGNKKELKNQYRAKWKKRLESMQR